MEEPKYEVTEGTYIHKSPKLPKPEDFHSIEETPEERSERIYLYSEVM